MRDLPPLAECRDCHEPIRFVTMPPGPNGTPPRRMPVNPKPNDTGTVVTQRQRGPLGITLAGYVVSKRRRQEAAYPLRFTPHHATCEAHQGAPTPEREPDPALF